MKMYLIKGKHHGETRIDYVRRSQDEDENVQLMEDIVRHEWLVALQIWYQLQVTKSRTTIKSESKFRKNCGQTFVAVGEVARLRSILRECGTSICRFRDNRKRDMQQ